MKSGRRDFVKGIATLGTRALVPGAAEVQGGGKNPSTPRRAAAAMIFDNVCEARVGVEAAGLELIAQS